MPDTPTTTTGEPLSSRPTVTDVLVTDRFPLLRPTAATPRGKNPTIAASSFLASIYGNLPGPNNRYDLRKTARCYDESTPEYFAGDETLSRLSSAPQYLCLGTICTVYFGPDGVAKDYEVVYDLNGPLTVYPDARFRGNRDVKAKWALKVGGAGSGVISLTGITEFRDRFAETFTGSVQEFAEKFLVKEQIPTYAQPVAALASTVTGQVERGTTITPTITTNFSQGDGGALTSYLLQRGSTQLAIDTTPPIAFPPVADSYKIGQETITYTVTFGYGQGPLKTTSQGNPAPGRIGAGSVQATATVQGVARLFYGASAPTTSAQVRALESSALVTQGNQFTLNTGSTSNRFAMWLPAGKSIVSVVDLDALGADITSQYVGSSFSVNDIGGTAVGGTLYLMSPAVPYSSNHRHVITTN